MRSQKEWVVPQRHFRMPAKKVVKPEQTDEQSLQHQQPDTERYQLQIDRQTKRSFKTSEAARSAALEIKSRFPILQVSIYDNVSNSRTVVDVPKSI
jgi:hemolysin activation/secretion protein